MTRIKAGALKLAPTCVKRMKLCRGIRMHEQTEDVVISFMTRQCDNTRCMNSFRKAATDIDVAA